MMYGSVYVGMEFHEETISLLLHELKEKAEYPQKVDGHYSKVINYIEAMRFHYRDDALFNTVTRLASSVYVISPADKS